MEGGELPLAIVRLTRPVHQKRRFDVIEEIEKVKVVIPDVLGLESDVMVTKTVEKRSDP